MVGYGGGQKDPMMEQAITILGMRPKVKDEDSVVSKKEPNQKKVSRNEQMSANRKEAEIYGKMFYNLYGKNTVQ